ncbi:MAG: hypothetical protein ABJD97_10085 [Betaproteobacteria bacterium]
MTAELTTPDGRYLILQGRLWRAQNPTLPAEARVRHTRELLNGRRALKAAKLAGDEAAMTAARAVIRDAEVGLGERGAVWWKDGTPDLNRQLAKNSPYAQWFATCAPEETPAPAQAQPKPQVQVARPA